MWNVGGKIENESACNIHPPSTHQVIRHVLESCAMSVEYSSLINHRLNKNASFPNCGVLNYNLIAPVILFMLSLVTHWILLFLL